MNDRPKIKVKSYQHKNQPLYLKKNTTNIYIIFCSKRHGTHTVFFIEMAFKMWQRSFYHAGKI